MSLFIERLEIHLKNIRVFSSYSQSLNEIYVHFSPLGITSINLRWVENRKVAERLIEIWKNVKQSYTFWNTLLKLRLSSKNSNMVKEVEDDHCCISLHMFLVWWNCFLQSVKQTNPCYCSWTSTYLKLRLLENVVKPIVLEHLQKWKTCLLIKI